VTLPFSSTHLYDPALIVPGARAPTTLSSRRQLFNRLVIVPSNDDVRVRRRRQRRARSPSIELREELSHLDNLGLGIEEGDGRRRLLQEIVVLALGVEDARERQVAARVVAEELDRLSQVHLGLGIPLHLREELSEVAVGPPRVGVGLEALPVPRECRLAVALIGGHQGAIVVGTREPRRQADALVEEAGGALAGR